MKVKPVVPLTGDVEFAETGGGVIEGCTLPTVVVTISVVVTLAEDAGMLAEGKSLLVTLTEGATLPVPAGLEKVPDRPPSVFVKVYPVVEFTGEVEFADTGGGVTDGSAVPKVEVTFLEGTGIPVDPAPASVVFPPVEAGRLNVPVRSPLVLVKVKPLGVDEELELGLGVRLGGGVATDAGGIPVPTPPVELITLKSPECVSTKLPEGAVTTISVSRVRVYWVGDEAGGVIAPPPEVAFDTAVALETVNTPVPAEGAPVGSSKPKPPVEFTVSV